MARPSRFSIGTHGEYDQQSPLRGLRRPEQRQVLFDGVLSGDGADDDLVHRALPPSASAAASPRPSAMPPAASTGVSPTASTIMGRTTMLAIQPTCPPPSVPCATITSAPAALARSASGTVPAMYITRLPAACARPKSARRS